MRFVFAVALAIVFASCTPGGPVVEMGDDHRFAPEELTISAGDRVKWDNHSDEAHTVTAEDGVPVYFASGGAGSEEAAQDDLSGGLIEPGESFDVVFDEPGVYRYYCIPHRADGMTGQIIVEE